MEFTLKHFLKEKVVLVTFDNTQKVKPKSWKQLNLMFNYMGANQCGNVSFLFPRYLNAGMLSELISNTCFECGGLMKDGVALDNTLISYDDFGGNAGNIGTTQSKCGEAKLIKVRKCQSCGHSHTI